MLLRMIIAVFLVGSLTGCATTQKATPVNQLQIRVAHLESQLDESDETIAELKYAIEELSASVDSMTAAPRSTRTSSVSTRTVSPTVSSSKYADVLRVSVAPQEVQKALKSAGYYTGAIDGKLGSGSQSAIKAFQKDNGMESDGIVGKKTWSELKGYLE